MPHISRVGQGRSVDCGYFCAYVLNVVRQHPGSPGQWTMEADAVITQRNAWQQSRGLRQGSYFAHYNDICQFLRFLGTPGYRAVNARRRGGMHTPETFRDMVQPHLSARHGVCLLLVGSGQGPGGGGGNGHYICIMRGMSRGGWIYYDPNHHVPRHSAEVPALDMARLVCQRADAMIYA